MKTMLRGAATICTAFGLFTTITGTADADADRFAGKSYKDAVATISSWNQVPVIATSVGGRVDTEDCLVTSSLSSKRQIGGSQQDVVLLNLFCGAPVATPGVPGNSVTTAAGKAAKEVVETAAWCSEPEQAALDGCAKFCKEHDGKCTANFES